MSHDVILEKRHQQKERQTMTHNKAKAAKKGIKILGIDLAKTSFQLHGTDKDGLVVLRKKLTRTQLIRFMSNLTPCLIGIEACGSSHYWSRVLKKMGHRVKMIAPQFVKGFVKSNKNDAVDAEAINEAVQRPNMRFVAEKSIEQQDVQSIHRIRSQVVGKRTAQSNQIRGLLLEYGVIIPKGISYVRKRIPEILEDGENGLTDLFRGLLSELYEEMVHFDDRVKQLEEKLQVLCQQNNDCQRLLTIPGVGLLTATALVSAIGDVNEFKNGRELAAWLGLVPRQHSTGGKPTLLGISKRGDTYLRTLLIHGGRSVVQVASKHDDNRNRWIVELGKRRNKNICAVAVANKNVRIAWSLLSKQKDYQENYQEAA